MTAPRTPAVGEDGPMTGVLPDPARARLLATLRPLLAEHRLALGGGDALRAHGLPARPSPDLVLVTDAPEPPAGTAAALVAALHASGRPARTHYADARHARLRAGEPAALPLGGPEPGEPLWIDLLKEPLDHPPVLLDLDPLGGPGDSAEGGERAPVPVPALPDAVRLTLTALYERGLPRDLADTHAVATRQPVGELLAVLRRALGPGFSAADLADRLERAATTAEQRSGGGARHTRWARAWAEDLRLDLMECGPGEDPDAGPGADDGV
jgi:hypothetical protein